MEKGYEKNIEGARPAPAAKPGVWRVLPGRRLTIEGKEYLAGDEVPAEYAVRHEAAGRVALELPAATERNSPLKSREEYEGT